MDDTKETWILNKDFLKKRMKEMKFTVAALSHAIEVDESTIIRWRSGKIKSVKTSHINDLCKQLECNQEKLIVQDDEEKITKNIANSFFFKTFFSNGKIKFGIFLIEKTIKSCFSKNEKGILYATRAFLYLMRGNLEKSEKICGQILLWKDKKTLESKLWANCVLGLLNIYLGNFNKSISCFEKAKSNSNFQYAQLVGKIGFGTTLMYQGNFHEACKNLKPAIKTLEKSNFEPKLLMAVMGYFNYVYTLIELNDYPQAKIELSKAINIAERISYGRGMKMLSLLDILISAHKKLLSGNSKKDNDTDLLLKKCKYILKKYPKKDPGFIHLEIASKIGRMLKDEKFLVKIEKKAKEKFLSQPCLGGIYKELGIHFLNSDPIKSLNYFDKSYEHYKKSGANFRLEKLGKFQKIETVDI